MLFTIRNVDKITWQGTQTETQLIELTYIMLRNHPGEHRASLQGLMPRNNKPPSAQVLAWLSQSVQ